MKIKRLALFPALAAIATASLGAQSATPASLAPTSLGSTTLTSQALHRQMTKTVVDRIDCSAGSGLCEVQSGSNIFYTDKAAHYLIIGHVYDLDAHVDLTEQHLARLKGLIGAGPGVGTSADGTPATLAASAPERIAIKGLTQAGAVVWGKPNAPTVSIFTDFHCPYCRAVVHELEGLDVRVVEYPISILGSRAVAEQVICARDRVKAMRDAYAGAPLLSKSCDTHGLDDNEAFARLHRIAETPVLVRADGAVLHGYRPRAFLATWLQGKPQ